MCSPAVLVQSASKLDSTVTSGEGPGKAWGPICVPGCWCLHQMPCHAASHLEAAPGRNPATTMRPCPPVASSHHHLIGHTAAPIRSHDCPPGQPHHCWPGHSRPLPLALGLPVCYPPGRAGGGVAPRYKLRDTVEEARPIMKYLPLPMPSCTGVVNHIIEGREHRSVGSYSPRIH